MWCILNFINKSFSIWRKSIFKMCSKMCNTGSASLVHNLTVPGYQRAKNTLEISWNVKEPALGISRAMASHSIDWFQSLNFDSNAWWLMPSLQRGRKATLHSLLLKSLKVHASVFCTISAFSLNLHVLILPLESVKVADYALHFGFELLH